MNTKQIPAQAGIESAHLSRDLSARNGLILPCVATVFLYKSPSISQAGTVRAVFTFAFLALATASYAQEQERKLVDRLLNPDAKLSNSDQNKKFTGGSDAAATRSFSTKSFYISEKKLTKSFVADRQAPTNTFSTHDYTTKPATLPAAPQMKTFQTKSAGKVSPNAYSTKTYATRNFAGNRPFLAQGKSQKALHQQDRPLTIDEVRELLNKNK